MIQIFISYAILQIFLLLSFKNIIQKEQKGNKIKIFLFIFINSIVNVILYECSLVSLTSIFNFVYFLFMIKYLFPITWQETFFYGITIWVITSLLDIIIMNISIYVSGNNEEIFQNDLSRILSTIVLILILFMITKNQWFKKFLDKLYKQIKKINLSKLLIALLLLAYICLDIICLYNIHIQNFGATMIMFAISTIMMIMIYIYKQYHIYILKTTNELLVKNNEQYTKMIQEYQIMKHNLINQLIGIQSIANPDTKKVIDQLIRSYSKKKINMEFLDKLPPGINGIIYEKIGELKNKKQVKMYISNQIEGSILDKIGPQKYNYLCEAIGISLDNAKEAIEKSKKKLFYLNFYEEEKKLIIKIVNSYSGSIDPDQLGTKNYTSKEEKSHGLGIFSLLNKKKIQINYNIRNNLFYVTIQVKKSLNE